MSETRSAVLTLADGRDVVVRVGDRIKFCSPTRWGGRKAVVRKVASLHRWVNQPGLGTKPTVRYGGYAYFVVHPREIVEVLPAPVRAEVVFIERGCIKRRHTGRWVAGFREAGAPANATLLDRASCKLVAQGRGANAVFQQPGDPK